MALSNFNPELWAARLLANLNNALVYGQPGVVNKDYEGEITGAGDSVRITSIGRVTIGTYSKNTNISAPEALQDAQQMLLIDQQKYFNFQVDDIDKAQNKPKVMDSAMREAAYGLRNTADGFLAALMRDGCDTNNLLGTTGSPKTVGIGGSDTNAYNLLVDLRVYLDEDNVPEEGRYVVVPPWFHGLLLKDERFTKGGAEDWVAQVFRSGTIKSVGGMAVLTSNNVPNTAGALYKIIAGHQIAVSYAEQIVEVEGYRPELRFGDAMKGLHVYGAKVVRPSALAMLTASKGTLS